MTKPAQSHRLQNMLDSSPLVDSLSRRKNAALIPSPIDQSQPDRSAGRRPNRAAAVLPMDQVIPDPEQPRKYFDETELANLAASIKSHGLLQPIRCRYSDEQKLWVIVSGERRYRAHKLINATEIAVVCDDRNRTDAEIKTHQLIENIQRESFKPVEEAKAFAELMTLESITAAELARRLKKGRQYVSQCLSLLKLSEDQQNQIDAGTLPVGQAYKLARQWKADSPSPTNAKAKASNKRKRGMEITYRGSNGAKIVIAFPKKVDDNTIRATLREVAENIGVADAA